MKNKLDCQIGYNLIFLVILPRDPRFVRIFKPIRIILVEILRVIVLVAQTSRVVVRAAGLILKWDAWLVLRLMINCPFQRHIVPVFRISLLRGQNLLVFCGCHKYRIEIKKVSFMTSVLNTWERYNVSPEPSYL